MEDLVKKDEVYLDVFSVKQRLVIHTTDKKKPVLLILHGHATPTSLFAGYYLEKTSVFIKNFTIVHWDQRGAGASFTHEVLPETMTQKQFVDDAHVVISYLKSRFDKEKVYILAQSWGSIIGLRYLSQYPEDVESYIGEGQAVNYPEFIKCMFDYALKEADSKGHFPAQMQLQNLELPGEGTDTKKAVRFYGKVKKWSSHFILQEYDGADLMGEFFSALKSSPYFKGLPAKMNLFRSILFTRHSTVAELLSTDLTKEIQSLQVPVYFFMGTLDFLLPATRRFFETLSCPEKELILFDPAGHVPSLDKTSEFEQEVSRVWGLLSPFE